MVTIICILLYLLVLALLVFHFGPAVLRWFLEKAEDWQEVLQDAREEK